jgi:hypothetical protein
MDNGSQPRDWGLSRTHTPKADRRKSPNSVNCTSWPTLYELCPSSPHRRVADRKLSCDRPIASVRRVLELVFDHGASLRSRKLSTAKVQGARECPLVELREPAPHHDWRVGQVETFSTQFVEGTTPMMTVDQLAVLVHLESDEYSALTDVVLERLERLGAKGRK